MDRARAAGLRLALSAAVAGAQTVGNCICVLAVAAGAAFADVQAYEQQVTMPTWEIGPPQVHSIFSDAGGDIYPYTLNEILTNNKVDKAYTGVFLENEYIKVLVLPEIGGRLHGALDKTNGYEFFYWQKHIKPGLISMTGAWISGGIEWNFPHGHRPSGFMPVDHRIIRHADGSATVWVGETEPILRMRWLVGLTVFPGKSYIRCDYVFVNPTSHKNSFQFWATSAAYTNDSVQAQYPGDVVTGHGKHEFWNWPVHEGVDLTWWKNTPNASSFFAFNNPSEWFGAYDHGKRAGMVHVANHHIAPGKKLWTWGAGPSGRIWDDILSDGQGPYIEPQAGVWSDNQPDYHWMQPHEVKTAHDVWYPVRDIRGFHNANEDFAVNTDLKDGVAFGGVYATSAVEGCKVVLKNTRTGAVLSEKVTAISPDKPYTIEVQAGGGAQVYDLHLAVYDPSGKLAIELRQQPAKKVELPPGEKDPGDPAKMNLDQLYHAGEWLDKFRRTGEALVYYREALKRDPADSRVNVEMGFLALKQGRWKDALDHLNKALERDGDNSRIYFGRGLAYDGLQKYAEAYDEFYRATYTYDFFAPAYLNLAKIDIRRGDLSKALGKLAEAESQNAKFADIPALRAAVLRRMGEGDKALAAAEKALELDPMHFLGGHEKLLALKSVARPSAEWEKTFTSYTRGDVQNHLELAMAYASAGLYGEADAALARVSEGKDAAAVEPLVNYFRGYFLELNGDAAGAGRFYAQARKGSPRWVNPSCLEARDALEAALRGTPSDANAHLFLGNLLYASGQREAGFAHWQQAVQWNDGLELAWRNLAYGRKYLKKDLQAAYTAYRKAAALDPSDARVLLEADQIAEELKAPSSERLSLLLKHPKAVDTRDDLVARVADLRLEQGGAENWNAVYQVLKERHFHSWEGRYGIHHAWVEVNKALGDAAFDKKDYQAALGYYQQAAEYPANLEVAARTPDFRAHVYWDLARVHQAIGRKDVANDYLKKILAEKYNKVHLGTYYQAMAAKMLGNTGEYRNLLAKLEREGRERTSGKFEYRGAPQTIGRYLLSLAVQEKDGKAAGRDPAAARLALLEAQIDIARAHQ